MICNCPKCLYAPAPTVNELQQRIEELRKKLTELASNNGLPLSPTEFECINMDGKIVVLDSKTIPTGTLIGYSNKCEAFRALAFDEYNKPWVLYTNLKMSHEEFAEMMRGRSNLPKIVYWGL